MWLIGFLSPYQLINTVNPVLIEYIGPGAKLVELVALIKIVIPICFNEQKDSVKYSLNFVQYCKG